MSNGAQAMVKCLREEGVAVVFGYPGAAICPFYDALAEDGAIRHILVRQEQNAGHAASGYARASGKVGVCVVTSGPGATNLITAIASAYQDSIPIVAITGQVRSDLLGRDVFQEADITGACAPFVKHSYLVTQAEELPHIFKEAFHIAATGRPGPVLIDVPVDVQQTELPAPFRYPEQVGVIGYKPRSKANSLQLKRALELLRTAKRPLIVAGGGVLSAGARNELRKFAEQAQIPVVSTMMAIGVMPWAHPLYLGMLGTFGVRPANRALHGADVLLIIGARVGDRAVALPDQVSERSKIIHIDVDPAEIGKNLTTTIPVVGEARNVLHDLMERLDFACPEEWAVTVQAWREESEASLSFDQTPGFVEPRRFMRLLSAEMEDRAVVVADVGQNQIWAANHFQLRTGRFMTSGGLGTMGYAIPAAVGAKLAKPHRQVVAVCGDGSFQMAMMELATMMQHDIPVKIVVLCNNRLGMVRELQDKNYEGREVAVDLAGSPDFIAIAQAYGIPGRAIDADGDAQAAIREMLAAKTPYLLQCRVNPAQGSL